MVSKLQSSFWDINVNIPIFPFERCLESGCCIGMSRSEVMWREHVSIQACLLHFIVKPSS